MCGRYTVTSSPENIAEFFAVVRGLGDDEPPRFNIAPTQRVLAIRCREAVRETTYLRWGLIPSWAKDESFGLKCLNARSETVATSPAFRQAFRHGRCLIPANGFYEWRKVGRRKEPLLFGLRGGGLFALAGLMEHWQSPTGQSVSSGTILTTTANALLEPIHDRMPVIVRPEDFGRWLDPQVESGAVFDDLLVPFPPDEMQCEAVSDIINNVRCDVDPRRPSGTRPRQRTLFDHD